jgi:hypothetical protein
MGTGAFASHQDFLLVSCFACFVHQTLYRWSSACYFVEKNVANGTLGICKTKEEYRYIDFLTQSTEEETYSLQPTFIDIVPIEKGSFNKAMFLLK